MSLHFEVFIMGSEDTLTTWFRAEDENGNVVYSRELTEKEIDTGTVRLAPTRISSGVTLSADWYSTD